MIPGGGALSETEYDCSLDNAVNKDIQPASVETHLFRPNHNFSRPEASINEYVALFKDLEDTVLFSGVSQVDRQSQHTEGESEGIALLSSVEGSSCNILTSVTTDLNFDSNVLSQERRTSIEYTTESFGLEEADEMIIAAEFLFACRCYEDSFTLYVALLEKSKHLLDDCPSIKTSAITGCMRSFVTLSQAEVVWDLLNKDAIKQSLDIKDPPELFIFRSRLADVFYKQRNNHSVPVHYLMATDSSLVSEAVTRMSEPLDLILYPSLNRALNRGGYPIAAWIVQ